MKITVNIDGESFEVEVSNLHQRPVIAKVGGVAFEVWPEGEAPFKSKPPGNKEAVHPIQKAIAYNGMVSNTVVAPIPGLIFLIKVQEGETVIPGQELCVLEAMKMKNVIRAPRAGQIAAVKVSNGQQVAEGDVLVEFSKSD
jgi:biotin carboxyl carrier protein